jgi:hypothetical protein
MLLPAQALPTREIHNVDDLETRQAWHSQLYEPFYTHEDIEKLGITWIEDLVRMAGIAQFSSDCSVIINGGPATRELNTLTVDDVESVEVYGVERFKLNPEAAINEARLRAAALGRPGPAAAPRRGTAIPSRPQTASAATAARVPITNADKAKFENQGTAKICPGAVYVWLR